MILQGLRFRTKYRRFEISNERAASYKSDTINLHCVNIENVLTNRSNILQKAAYAAINLRPRLTSISCRSISPRLFPKANVVPFFVGVKYSIEVWRDKHRCTRQYRLGICEYTSIQVHFRAFTRGDSRHGVPAGLFLTLIEPLSLSFSSVRTSWQLSRVATTPDPSENCPSLSSIVCKSPSVFLSPVFCTICRRKGARRRCRRRVRQRWERVEGERERDGTGRKRE